MIYRYKLRETPKTLNINIKAIEGVKLYKHQWIYSNEQLNFNAYKDIVIEDFADKKEDFAIRDKEKKQAILVQKKEKGKQVLIDKKKNIQKLVNNMTKKHLEHKTDYQLKRILHYLDFEKNEYDSLDRNGLISLILLERKVDENRKEIKENAINEKIKKLAKENK